MRLLSVTAIALLAACSKGAGPSDIVVRDSAGVEIIEHPASAIAAAPQWNLGPAEATITHGATEDAAFSYVANATRLPDGRIVVVDGQMDGALVTVHAPDGSYERSLGRPGMGPGEFMFAGLVGVAGDTLIFYDTRNSRSTRMLVSGTLVSTGELARLGMMAVGTPAGTLADGRLISTPYFFGDTVDHGHRYRQFAPIIAIDPVAVHLDTLTTTIPGTEVFMLTGNLGGTTRSFPTPVVYGPRTLISPAREVVHVASNESSALDTYSLPWALQRSVRFAMPRRPVDEEARGAARAAALANIERAGSNAEAMKATMIDMIGRAEMADSMAWYAGMGAGSDGSVWLRETRSTSDSVPHYLVIGKEGRLQGRADLPKGARLLWVDADRVLISLLDDDEVPRVELRPIVKGAPAP